VLELDASTFDETIGGDPVVVDFWAPWCRPCIALEPVLEQLQDRVSVARLNIDEHPEIAGRYEILSIPTVMLFAGGEARGTVVGLRPLSHFEGWLAEVLPARELDGLAAQRHDDA
jgi:thioredoxin 1